MTTAYWIIGWILFVVAIVSSIGMTCILVMVKRDGESEKEQREVARFTLAAYSAMVLVWAWPLVIPLVILGGLVYVIHAAFKSLPEE